MKHQGFGFGGRPPRLPFSRAAAALASDVTLPPLRPSATAAGFLRGIGDLLHAIKRRSARQQCVQARIRLAQGWNGAAGDVVVAAVLLREGCLARNRPKALHGMCDRFAAVREVATGRGVLFHETNIPNRLDYVNGAKWA